MFSWIYHLTHLSLEGRVIIYIKVWKVGEESVENTAEGARTLEWKGDIQSNPYTAVDKIESTVVYPVLSVQLH